MVVRLSTACTHCMNQPGPEPAVILLPWALSFPLWRHESIMETQHLNLFTPSPHLHTPLCLTAPLGASPYESCGDKDIRSTSGGHLKISEDGNVYTESILPQLRSQRKCEHPSWSGKSLGPVTGSVWRMSCDLLHDAGKSEHATVCEVLL